MKNLYSIKICFVIAILFLNGCKPKKQETNKITKESNAKQIEFTYQDITGIGKDAKYNRRDNSDVIKVGDTFYVYYSKMDSPTTSGYWATIWYATSKDEGYTWQEQGMALNVGAKGKFDSHSVFTPNILVHKGKYYLYYTGVKPTPGNKKGEFEGNHTTDFTAIGLAVSDNPEGPFKRVEKNPVLDVSKTPKGFDSYRIDDASILVKDDKIWLYYKGRSIIHGAKGPKMTEMSVAIADTPESVYVKNPTSILDKSHEVLIWKQKEGISSLASINKTISIAKDGKKFETAYTKLKKIPKAPGLYRPSLTDFDKIDGLPNWGIAMIQKKGLAYLLRFEISEK